MLQPLDTAAVRRWCALGREALRAERSRMDAINVFPVADGDTGTNLCLTFEAAARAAAEATAGARGEEREGEAGPGDGGAGVLRVMARAALLEARGNSGTILAEYLRGMAQGLAEESAQERALPCALRRAAEAAYAAVARPVEGTMLTVAAAAAEAAEAEGDPASAAREALAATPAQLPSLSRAGVVDAGALGLTTLLAALIAALPPSAGAPRDTGVTPQRAQTEAGRSCAVPAPVHPADVPTASAPACEAAPANEAAPAEATPANEAAPAEAAPEFEVMYLIEAEDIKAVDALRERLDALGDSLVIGGGDGLWSVHVHVADAGAAVEAGLAAGRPYRVRIAHLPSLPEHGTEEGGEAARETPESSGARAVVAVVPGEGLAGLCREAGAAVVPAADAARDDALLAAVQATGAAEAVLLPNGTEFHAAAARAADAARARGVRATVIPTRAAVQGLAALAVHAPGCRFDEDVVAMTSAAGATRYGEVTVAARESWTTAGICQAGDVLGLVEGDVAVIGADVGQVAMDVLVRMLAAGGELVTLVLGEDAPRGLAAGLEAYVRGSHLAVDTVVYEGQQQTSPLLVGVE
ncbi:DAK2 domain-containing protein [Streptomyces sp. NBC_01187]|uniref:DAK2 domain-containing protein n=1 Tax=Streptomyces sp. NBC_01187 TaxID=2903766 RepID=UPI003869557C|nr:DAK2 domain-containing protein [Streptomyces sp. NBC_01187]